MKMLLAMGKVQTLCTVVAGDFDAVQEQPGEQAIGNYSIDSAVAIYAGRIH